MLAAKFSETCILKYFDTMTNFPNTVKQMQHKTANKLLTSPAESGRSVMATNHILCPHSPTSLLGIGNSKTSMSILTKYRPDTRYWYRCIPSLELRLN